VTKNLIRMIVGTNEGTNSTLCKLIGKVYLTSNLNIRTLNRMYENDVLIPFAVLGFRPHMRYVTSCVIKAKAGAETGETLVAHSYMDLQDDAAVKTTIGHQTLHSGAQVYETKNVFVQENAMCNRCLGGASWVPIHPETYRPTNGDTGGGSVIYSLAPYERTEYPNFMDVTGRFAQASSPNYVDGDRLQVPLYDQCWRTVVTFGIGGRGFVGGDDFMGVSESKLSNTVVCMGQQYNFSLATNDFTDKITNKGHFGPEGPGSTTCRNGGYKTMVSYDKVELV
jgi:hypothetical protein